MVDIEARHNFKGGVPTNIIKSSYGINPYAVRENLIDKNKPTTCLRCGQEETWLHVIQCCARKHETSEWKIEIIQKTKKLKENEEIMNDVEVFINDTIDVLQGTNSGRGTQALVGHDMLFRGFIVKDWFGGNINQTKYHNVNKIIVKESVTYYGKCWKDRNEVAANPTIRRDRKMIWLNNFIKNNESCEHQILRQYV